MKKRGGGKIRPRRARRNRHEGKQRQHHERATGGDERGVEQHVAATLDHRVPHCVQRCRREDGERDT